MKSNPLSVLALTAVVVSAFGRSGAQTRPMPPDPYDPMAATQQVAPAQAPAAQAAGVSGYGTSYQGPYDYPAAEVNALPVARAQQVVARAVYDRARSSLYTTVDNLHE